MFKNYLLKKSVVLLTSFLIILLFLKAAPPKSKVEMNDKTPYLPDSVTELGKLLFNDPILSVNKKISCSSCHKKEFYYGDSIPFNTGANDHLLTRNTLPFAHLKSDEKHLYFWGGTFTDLSDAILHHLSDSSIMGINDKTLSKRLYGNTFYRAKFKKLYGINKIDINAVSVILTDYIKNIKYNKPTYDPKLADPEKYLSSNVAHAIRFCQQCHKNSETINEMTNIGLSANDTGMYIIPVLANLKNTAPYMHDGRFKTLEEVIMHYNSGIQLNSKTDPLLIKNGVPIQLHLTDSEIKEMALLLHSIQRKIK